MRFLLNGNEVSLLVAPSGSFTQDETPDTFNCVLEANNIATPIAPMQSFVIEWDSGEKSIFYVVLDTVEVFSTSPQLYTHKLTLCQNIQALQKNILRNTIFSQPADREKKCLFSKPYCFNPTLVMYEPYSVFLTDNLSIANYWDEPAIISKKEKVSNVKYRINVYTIRNKVLKDGSTYFQDNYFQKETGNVYNFLMSGRVLFSISDMDDGNVESVRMDIDPRIELNKWYDTPNDVISFIKSLENKEISITNSLTSVSFNTNNSGYAKDAINNLIIHIETKIETCYYSAYDVLEIAAKQYSKKRAYTDYDLVYQMPSAESELGKLLKRTIVPNMAFTQSTLYEVVNQVFKLFDAIFTLDENKTLGIEYFNNNNNTKINNLKYSGYQSSFTEKNYSNRFICNYQNAIQKSIYPRDSFAIAGSSNLGVPKEEDHIFKLPYQINTLTKLEMRIEGRSTISGVVVNFGTGITTFTFDFLESFPLDLSYHIKENTIWSLLDKSTVYPRNGTIDINNVLYTVGNYRLLAQNSCLHYSRGSSDIPLAEKYTDGAGRSYNIIYNVVAGALYRLFGRGYESGEYVLPPDTLPGIDFLPASARWDKLFFKAECVFVTNGVASIESQTNKYEGEIITNQGEGNVDLSKLGTNILGLSYRSGEPTLTITHEITSPSQMIKKGSIWLRNNEKWFANVCTYSIYNNKVVGNIEFSKNYNAISLSTRINNQKRLSNIASELTLQSKDWINEFVYLSTHIIDEESQEIGMDHIFSYIGKTFGKDSIYKEIQMAAIGTSQAHACYIPLRMYVFGNSLTFEMEYSSPISAGYRLTRNGNKYFNETVNYADENGFLDVCSIYFINKGTNELTELYPEYDNYAHEIVSSIDEWECYKKPNEILGLTYQLTFLPYNEEIIIGKKFLEKNGFWNETNNEKLYLMDVGEEVSVFDEVIDQPDYFVEIQDFYFQNNVLYIDVGNEDFDINNWAIADYDGNIYLAGNNRINTQNFKIYFITRHKRI